MSKPPETAVVYGADGFVGNAVVSALTHEGIRVVARRAPRLRRNPTPVTEIDVSVVRVWAADESAALGALCPDVVINAAGISDATGIESESMFGANGVLPAVLGHAAYASGASYVHVSSAAVQGSDHVLDSTHTWDPQSPYARSKASGERLLLATMPAGAAMTIYRPPGVHAPGRRVTQMLRRYAASALASTSAAERGSPQALLSNVADAILFLALSPSPPVIVHHPSEGVTNQSLLRILGGHRPHLVADPLARSTVSLVRAAGRRGWLRPSHAVRFQLLLLGQEQDVSWLTESGWSPPVGHSGWWGLSPALLGAGDE